MRQQKDLGLWNQCALGLHPGPLRCLIFTFDEPQVAPSGNWVIIGIECVDLGS